MNPFVAERLRPFESTIFAEMSALALATGSLNLGQGFPDTDGPAVVRRYAMDAIEQGYNQYPPGTGVAALREAIVAHQRRFYGLAYDAEEEVLVTTGATEALASVLLALCGPGDEVVLFEPYYDAYAALVALAGATRRVVPIRGSELVLDEADLDAAIGPSTKVLLLNSPHNPTGKVFSRGELAQIARRCIEHDVIVVTDEVYEHLVYEGDHRPIATLPGMASRTVTISSAGKTFALTGWKIGWACGPAELIGALRSVKQFLTYVSGAPFQVAIARALDEIETILPPVRDALMSQRDLLVDGLTRLGLVPGRPAAGYFATTDVSVLGYDDGERFCRELPERCGVVAIPSVVFYDDLETGRTLVRWAFCKSPSLITEALERLESLVPRRAEREVAGAERR